MDTALLHSLAKTGARCAVVSGSGIRATLRAKLHHRLPYGSLSGWPKHVVDGHGSSLDVCEITGIPVLVFSGRFHRYEGHTLDTTVLPLKLMAELGIGRVILTNAAGGLHPNLRAGDILLPEDVLDLTMTHQATGRRFPMDGEWRASVETSCIRAGVHTTGGTLAQVLGPSYETRAEVRMLRRIGADAVGMSTVHEAQYAASIGIKPIIVTTITNVASDSSGTPINHAHVVDAAALAARRINVVLECAIQSAT